ncbi:MAG TPA: ABC transporter ATP-binding protein [Chloroflexota bacterium]|jgi:ABC-type branched-subunit amino acid transport system ATPase component
MTDDLALRVTGVSRSFGGVHAVDGCSFEVRRGTITGLIGPNGAGKSTMLNLLAGALRPDQGSIRFFGGEIARLPSFQIARLGLARTFQLSSEFARMTVLENLMVAPLNQRGDSAWAALLGPSVWKRQEREHVATAWNLLQRFNLVHLAHEYAGNLSGGQKRLLELARALHMKPRLLLLDEPMAGVNPALISQLTDYIADLRREGLTVVMVEHEMGTVERLCDPVIVMAQGRVLAEGSMAEIRANEAVVAAYLSGQRV